MIYHISIYKDKKDNLLLIPCVRTDGGFSVEFNKPVILEAPYAYTTIGERVRECLEASMKEPIYSSKEDIRVYEIVTGIKSYSKFSKDRLLVMVYYDTEKGFTFSPSKRFPDGSYRPDEETYPDSKLDLNATNEQIGDAVVDRLNAIKEQKQSTLEIYV